MKKTEASILKKEVITRVCKQAKCRRKEAEDIINAYTDIMIEELKEKHSFRIKRLGTLRHLHSLPRNGFNPVRQKNEVFKGKNKIKFTPSVTMAKLLNPPEEDKQD